MSNWFRGEDGNKLDLFLEFLGGIIGGEIIEKIIANDLNANKAWRETVIEYGINIRVNN
mgnify:FL=1